MIDVLSVLNMRKSDEATINSNISSLELMKRAGEGIYKSVKWHGNVLIVAGTGNNAGDGYVLADLLKNDVNVTIFIISNKFSNDGKYYFDIVKDKVKVILEDLNKIDFDSYDFIVDCIFGTGFNRNIEDPYYNIIDKINKSKSYKISVDINSGLNGDNGLANIAIKSDLTLAIGYPKTGYYLNDGKDYINNIRILDIGIKAIYKPYKLLEADDLIKLFPSRKNSSNKGNYGYIALIGGSVPYSGAIRLANMANSAMRAGAGVCMLAIPKVISNVVATNILESTIYPLSDDGLYIKFKKDEIDGLINKCKSITFGMGIGNTDDTKFILEYLLDNYDKTLVIDADGLNALSKIDKNKIRNTQAKLILTPHLKEFERISGNKIDEIKKDSINLAIKFAKEYNLILLLKGPSTIITNGEELYIVNRGVAGMATAGSGDVLSGIISSISASNQDNLLLSVAGAAYINGLAGEIAEEKASDVTMVASDTANNIKDAIEGILKLRK